MYNYLRDLCCVIACYCNCVISVFVIYCSIYELYLDELITFTSCLYLTSFWACHSILTTTIWHSIKTSVLPTYNGGRAIHPVSYITRYCQSFLELGQGGRQYSAISYSRNGTCDSCKIKIKMLVIKKKRKFSSIQNAVILINLKKEYILIMDRISIFFTVL